MDPNLGDRMNSFRLLNVGIDTEQDDTFPGLWRSLGQEHPLEIIPRDLAHAGRANWVSVITGRNGLGKSRTLGATAGLFAAAQARGIRTRDRSGAQWRVKYLRGTDVCELWGTPSGNIRARVNNEICSVDSVPLPAKVVALSTTATDKFPLPKSNDSFDDASREDVYNYMGLRDRSGRASATAVVYRALEALVEATKATNDRRHRIAEVFDFLGYTPRVEHTYRWRYGSLSRDPNALAGLLERGPDGPANPNVAARLRRLIAKDPSLLDELQRIVNSSIAATGPQRELRLVADFYNPGANDLARFRDTQLLRRAGLVDLAAVELERSDSGLKIDLREVSSGELSLATTFLGLAAVIEDDALVLIDEPEVSLHPEWQSEYLNLLTVIFSKYQGCHFVIATHSPLVVSGVPPEAANVVSLDHSREGSTAGREYAGDSIDEVLVREFNVASKNNLFVKQLLVEALRLAADGELASPEFANSLRPLAALASSLEASPTRDLIEQLVRAQEVELS